jgi:hypothetical protein
MTQIMDIKTKGVVQFMENLGQPLSGFPLLLRECKPDAVAEMTVSSCFGYCMVLWCKLSEKNFVYTDHLTCTAVPYCWADPGFSLLKDKFYSQICCDIFCAVQEWPCFCSMCHKDKNNNNKTKIHRRTGEINHIRPHSEEEI